jgi:FixJ family two-component response regulator
MTDSGTVYVVDDDPSHLAAVGRLLRAAGFEARTFESGPGLLAEVSEDACGCVVADLQMPGLNGLQLQEALAQSRAPLPVVFLTGHADIPSTVRAMRQGAVDFLEKRAPAQELIAAVRRALECHAAARAARAKHDALHRRFAALTPREHEVLRRVVRGRMNKQIAADLGIHERTVKLHRTAITRKVGVSSVAELTTVTRDAGLYAWDPPGRA